MSALRSILPTLAISAALGLLVGWLGGHLSHWGLSIQLDFLYVLFPSLYLGFPQLLWVGGLVGLCLDAFRPTPFGMTPAILIGAGYFLLLAQPRLRPENPVHVALAALAGEFFVCVAPTLLLSGASLLHLAINGLLSCALAALLANPLVNLQRLASGAWSPLRAR